MILYRVPMENDPEVVQFRKPCKSPIRSPGALFLEDVLGGQSHIH